MSHVINNLEKLNFVNKNWHNNVRADCKAPLNLVKFIKFSIRLMGELKEFEGLFEWDELKET
jgi:hypothetical protein